MDWDKSRTPVAQQRRLAHKMFNRAAFRMREISVERSSEDYCYRLWLKIANYWDRRIQALGKTCPECGGEMDDEDNAIFEMCYSCACQFYAVPFK